MAMTGRREDPLLQRSTKRAEIGSILIHDFKKSQHRRRFIYRARNISASHATSQSVKIQYAFTNQHVLFPRIIISTARLFQCKLCTTQESQLFFHLIFANNSKHSLDCVKPYRDQVTRYIIQLFQCKLLYVPHSELKHE